MIRSFSTQGTEDLYHGVRSRDARRIATDIQRTALRKLEMINAAHSVEDLRSTPGNRLEALRGDLKGYYRIRINDQWRIVFSMERWRCRQCRNYGLPQVTYAAT